MKFIVNEIEWEIVEVEKTHSGLKMGDNSMLGTCNYEECVIYIMQELNKGMKRNVLAHEITHAVIEAMGFYANKTFDQEAMCEFIAHNGKLVVDLTEQYMFLNYSDRSVHEERF